ncbi:MAG TPA: hypothetical protein DCF49_01430, partial [Lachnospiraceae bacterium]|nr:hypothetical protein [Lachnospiraceae bacterium]
FERLLTGRTGIYYIPENGGSDDWEKLDDSTKLDPEQDVILHIAFEIPAGKLNATNAKTEYELPLSISMTEDEVDDINKYESRVFIGTDREADDLGNAGSFEIEEEYNGNGDVTERKAVITFNSDTCTKVGGEKLTNGTVTAKPESIEGFLEMTISAEDLLTLNTAGEAKYTLEWNDDGSLDTTVAFDAEKLQAYLDKKNGKTEEASAAETVEESAAAATTEEIAKAEEEAVAAEENATEEEAKAEEAEPVQEEAPAAAYASGKLDYDGGSYTVTASFDESAKLPEGVQLSVKELTGASYQKYLSEANEAVGENKEVTGGRFFDITFTDANGKPVEPQGMVDVRINYKNTETIEQGTNVEGVHFTEQGAQTIDVDAKGVAENTVDVVGFQSDSFSVYGVVYTVDFEYTDPTT